MSDYQAVPADDEARSRPATASATSPRTSSSSRAAATTSSACRPTAATRVGPEGDARARGRRRRAADGLRVLARGARGHDPAGVGGHRRTCRCSSPRTASAPTTTSSGSSTCERPSTACSLPRRRHRRAGLHLLEPARQLRVGVRLRPAVRDRRRRPDDPGAHGEAQRRVAGPGGPDQRPGLDEDRRLAGRCPECRRGETVGGRAGRPTLDHECTAKHPQAASPEDARPEVRRRSPSSTSSSVRAC